MVAQVTPTPVQKFWDNNGFPASGAKIFTYIAGTTTKQAAYTDSTQSTPLTNPAICNARGELAIWLDPTKYYKITAAPSTDGDPPTNAFWTQDNLAAGVLGISGNASGNVTIGPPSVSSGQALTVTTSSNGNGIVINVPAATNTGAVIVQGSTTGYSYISMSNTGAQMNFGIDSSVGSVSGTAYAVFLSSSGGTRSLVFGSNAQYPLVVDFSGTVNVVTTGILGSVGLNLSAGTTAVAPMRIPHGAAPTSPVNGDMWTTTAGLFVRINGATVGPLT